MTEQTPGRALAFGAVADSYDRGRPGYPREAAVWLTGASPLTVLELGAGTGKLTSELVALGHVVHATDPDRAMLDVLATRVPGVRRAVASAEDIPLPANSVDVVVAAQCFHWFDPEPALAEIARVLKRGGRLSLVWNERDDSIPWVRRLGALMETPPEQARATEALLVSPLFGPVEQESFGFWQQVDRKSVQDLIRSSSAVAQLDDAAREARVAEALALYDSYGRGMDGMRVPWTARCFRAVVNEPHGSGSPQPSRYADPPAGRSPGGPDDPPSAAPPAGGSDGTDPDLLLIDFR